MAAGRGRGEQQSDSGCMIKVEQTEFADALRWV